MPLSGGCLQPFQSYCHDGSEQREFAALRCMRVSDPDRTAAKMGTPRAWHLSAVVGRKPAMPQGGRGTQDGPSVSLGKAERSETSVATAAVGFHHRGLARSRMRD